MKQKFYPESNLVALSSSLKMGELGFDDVSFTSEVFTKLSTVFDQVLAECNHHLKTNYFSVIDEKKWYEKGSNFQW